MGPTSARAADYGNWIPQRVVGLFLGNAAALGLGAWLLPWPPVQIVLGVSAGLSLTLFLVMALTYRQLGRDGGAIQRRFHAVLVEGLAWPGQGKVLDVGTGNGAVAILLAQRFPAAQVTGVDPWGKPWAYSQATCEQNARLEGVESRVSFQRAWAQALPFRDGEFDALVSSFVFHAVAVDDRSTLLHEALRTLKPGGAFVFQDLFHRQFYGDLTALLARLRESGIEELCFVPMKDFFPIPLLLQNPQVAGGSHLLCGIKPFAREVVFGREVSP